MGGSSSKLEKALAESPEDEKYYGLENFGNTCYCNSVLQALYFCRPFRERLLQYAASLPENVEENLLNSLAELFVQVGMHSYALLRSADPTVGMADDKLLLETCHDGRDSRHHAPHA